LTPAARSYKYYDILLGASVAVLLCSNLIGPGKTVLVDLPLLGAVTFGAGNVFFPISYIFGDVFTEVYGFGHARKAIWVGFGSMLFAAIMSTVVLRLPADPREPFNETLQPALAVVFGSTWRIAAASLIAYWAGDFVNSYVMARMKVVTQGKHLWTRTVGSTLAGQFVDSMIFYPLSFYGVLQSSTVAHVALSNWLFKVSVEVVLTPVTYAIVGALKRSEREDYFDRDTNFSPFTLDG
jgi:uncharacterized integral membrane protein (TIGR00697 family)